MDILSAEVKDQDHLASSLASPTSNENATPSTPQTPTRRKQRSLYELSQTLDSPASGAASSTTTITSPISSASSSPTSLAVHLSAPDASAQPVPPLSPEAELEVHEEKQNHDNEEVDWTLLKELLSSDDEKSIRKYFAEDPLAHIDRQCEVEEAVDHLESICSKLYALERRLKNNIKSFHDRQVSGAEPVLEALEAKNAAVIDLLKRTRLEESGIRQKIDAISHNVEKSKATIQAAEDLSLQSSKIAKERSNLEQFRATRTAALKQLEDLVTVRSLAQNQILNLSTIQAELRADVKKRNYQLIVTSLSSQFFSRSFGLEGQTSLIDQVKILHQYRRTSRECQKRLRKVTLAHMHVRDKLARIVNRYWK